MNFPHATLLRLQDSINEESLGYFVAFEGVKKLMECKTLELPDRQNQNNISRIPAKTYFVRPRWSKKYRNHFIVTNVEGREYVLFHVLNTHKQTRGCIGPGVDYAHIDGDKILDVTSSRYMLNRMLKLMPKGFWLTIIDQDKPPVV